MQREHIIASHYELIWLHEAGRFSCIIIFLLLLSFTFVCLALAGVSS